MKKMHPVGGKTNWELGMRNLTNELGVRFEVGGKKIAVGISAVNKVWKNVSGCFL